MWWLWLCFVFPWWLMNLKHFFFSHADFLLGNSICKESITLLAYFHIRFVFFTDFSEKSVCDCVYDFRKQGLKFRISVPFSSWSHLKFFKNLFSLVYTCLTMCVSFCSTMWLNHIYTYILSPLSLLVASYPSKSPQSTRLSTMFYTAASHQPSILHMTVHGCQCPSLHCPTSSVPLCVHKSFSASVCIFLLCK